MLKVPLLFQLHYLLPILWRPAHLLVFLPHDVVLCDKALVNNYAVFQSEEESGGGSNIFVVRELTTGEKNKLSARTL